jgi:hypothetical protein
MSLPEDPAHLARRRAEACRRLADFSIKPERKARWIERAGHWEKLALEAEKQTPPATAVAGHYTATA